MLGQRYLYDGKSILDLNERQKESCKRIIDNRSTKTQNTSLRDFSVNVVQAKKRLIFWQKKTVMG